MRIFIPVRLVLHGNKSSNENCQPYWCGVIWNDLSGDSWLICRLLKCFMIPKPAYR